MIAAIIILSIALVAASASSVYLSRQLRDAVAGERAATEAQFAAERGRVAVERERDLERAARAKSDVERVAIADQLVNTQDKLNKAVAELARRVELDVFGSTPERAMDMVNQLLGLPL